MFDFFLFPWLFLVSWGLIPCILFPFTGDILSHVRAVNVNAYFTNGRCFLYLSSYSLPSHYNEITRPYLYTPHT